jgi:hypothetical protein
MHVEIIEYGGRRYEWEVLEIDYRFNEDCDGCNWLQVKVKKKEGEK